MNFQRAAIRRVQMDFKEVARLFMEKTGAKGIAIYTYEAKSRQLHLLSTIGENKCFKKANFLKLGREIPESICIKKKPFFVSNQKDYKFLKNISGCLFVFPIFFHKNFTGVLIAHFLNKKKNIKNISTMGREFDLLKVCLHSYVAFKTMSDEVTGLKMVDDINRIVATELNLERLYYKMYDQVKRIVQVKNLRLDLYDQEKQRLNTVFFINDGRREKGHPVININTSKILSEVYRKRMVMLTSEYKRLMRKRKDIHHHSGMKVASFIIMPLMVRDNFLGVLMIWDPNRKNIFKNNVVRFLKIMVGQSAIAIYNARLFEQLNKAINDLTLLYQIEYHISSILNIEELLNTAVRLIDSALGNLITAILLPDEKKEKLEIKAITPGVEIKPGFEKSPFIPRYRW